MFDSEVNARVYFWNLADAGLGYVIRLGQHRRVRQALIITAVLSLSIALPTRLSLLRLLLFIGILVAAPFSLLLLKQSSWGIVALVAAALILPSPDLPGGFNLTTLLLAALVGLWLMDMFIVQRKIWVVSSRPIKPLLSLLFVVFISFLFGQIRWFSQTQPAPLDAQFGGLLIFVLAIGGFLLAAQQIRELRWLQWMTWIYIALGALFLLLFLVGLQVSSIVPITYRLFQMGATSNSLFWTWLAALAFSQALLNNDLHLGWRIAMAGVVLTTLYIGIDLMNDWKSGYLPVLAAIAAILALRSWRFGLFMLLVAPFAAYYIASQAIATDAYSYSTRIDAWIIMFEIIKASPVFGLGPANYYWYTPLFPIRGWAVQFNSHNQYVDIIAQTGILGAACTLWFFVEEGLLCWRLRNKAPAGFAKAYVFGVFGGLVGMIVGGMLADWFFPFVYNIGFNGFRGAIPAWLFLGGLVSLEQIIVKHN